MAGGLTQRDEEGDPVDYTENIDGPAEPIGWDRPGYNDLAWAPATVIGLHPTLPWTHLVPVRTRIVYAPVRAVSVTRLPTGALVVDFGKVYAAIPQVTFHQGVAAPTLNAALRARLVTSTRVFFVSFPSSTAGAVGSATTAVLSAVA